MIIDSYRYRWIKNKFYIGLFYILDLPHDWTDIQLYKMNMYKINKKNIFIFVHMCTCFLFIFYFYVYYFLFLCVLFFICFLFIWCCVFDGFRLSMEARNVVRARFRVVVVVIIGYYNMARIGKRIVVIVVEVDIIALRLLLPVGRVAALKLLHLHLLLVLLLLRLL